MTQIDDTEYMQVIRTTDRFNPVIRTRTLEKRKVGTWLFGLLPVYEYFYSDWSEK
jgi:hypothetical protein